MMCVVKGRQPGGDDLYVWTGVASEEQLVSTRRALGRGTELDGVRVYVSALCLNHAGLASLIR